MKYIAYCTKGLEQIVKNEIEHNLPYAKIISIGSKRVIFDSENSAEELTKLRTVDDIGLLVISFSYLNFNSLIEELKKIDWAGIKKALTNTKKMVDKNFSITTSIVGLKNFDPSNLISQFSQYLQQINKWNFSELDHSDFDIRIFIDHDLGYVSVRLTKEALHHRAYKTFSKIGSLKPSVAAAMVYLATERRKDLKIVDNFCGSGTILAEAFLIGNAVFGGDIDSESVVITRNNLLNLKYKLADRIGQLNALSTSWQTHFFDCAISNLPWGKQVEVKSITDLYIGTLREYARIIKSDGVLCLLISKPELLIKHAKKEFPNSNIEEIKIGLLGQNPSIVIIKRRPSTTLFSTSH